MTCCSKHDSQGWRTRFRPAIVFLLQVGLTVGSWHFIALFIEATRGVPFPTPRGTLGRCLSLLCGSPLLDHTIYRHLFDSLTRWTAGFSLAVLIGVPLGLLIGRWTILECLFLPMVHILQLIPGLAWIPIAILVLGVCPEATIFMISVTALAPIVLNVVSGVKRVDGTYMRAARMMGTGEGSLFLHVLIPGALPEILGGLRIGLGNGWRVLVAGEMVVGTGTGLGYAIIQARWTLDYEGAFACVLFICLIGLLVEHLTMRQLERSTIEKWGLTRVAW